MTELRGAVSARELRHPAAPAARANGAGVKGERLTPLVGAVVSCFAGLAVDEDGAERGQGGEGGEVVGAGNEGSPISTMNEEAPPCV